MHPIRARDVLLQYGVTSTSFRDTIAALCCRLCNTITPYSLGGYSCTCSQPSYYFGQSRSVRLIGIGEILHRIVGKTICLATHIDVTVACGSDQLCADLSSGIEGAIHVMNSLFMDHQYSLSGWGVLMVDGSNAFNSLNRTAMLLQACVLWPCCARFLFNTYYYHG